MHKTLGVMRAAGMDNVRNMTGSPIAGIDPHEFLDVRPLNYGAPQGVDQTSGCKNLRRHIFL